MAVPSIWSFCSWLPRLTPGFSCLRFRAWLQELTSDTVAVAHGGTMRALMVAAGVATTLEAIEAQVEQGVVYVFAGGKLNKYG